MISQRKKKIDAMIAGGLQSAGIELDADQKRALLPSTPGSQAPSADYGGFTLPALATQNATPRIGLNNCETTDDDDSEYNVYGQNSLDVSPNISSAVKALMGGTGGNFQVQ